MIRLLLFGIQAKAVMERHFKFAEQPMTFEMLEELSRTSPRRTVDMIGADLTFTQQGEFKLSTDYCHLQFSLIVVGASCTYLVEYNYHCCCCCLVVAAAAAVVVVVVVVVVAVATAAFDDVVTVTDAITAAVLLLMLLLLLLL